MKLSPGFVLVVSFAVSILTAGCSAEKDLAESLPGIPAQITEEIQVNTLTPSPSPAVSPTLQAPATDTPVYIPSSTATQIPESFFINDISGTGQYFALGCEASAAVDWANYFGVLIYEYNFQHELPISDNPDLGFVGDAKGPWGQVPPYAYGVHAGPVANLLREYGLPAVGVKGLTLDQIKASLAASKPVIAWVIGNMVGGIPYEYTDKEGNLTTVAAYEHVVILTGYSLENIRYLNNGKFYEVPDDVFLNSWGVLGNMAVLHE
ncbi:MAG TPA: C39 family peptidase [Anaerolineaceae bacterium]|nr:C39 family peptidase [Anaerolineaceae bacterium]